MTQSALQKAKANAPKVPPDTCPYIDSVLEMLDHMEDQTNMDDLDRERIELMRSTLEYVRSANQTLRSSSFYWYEKYKDKR